MITVIPTIGQCQRSGRSPSGSTTNAEIMCPTTKPIKAPSVSGGMMLVRPEGGSCGGGCMEKVLKFIGRLERPDHDDIGFAARRDPYDCRRAFNAINLAR